MIERFDVNSSGYKGRRDTSTVLDEEENAHFRKFLTFLEEIEQFYDCIGGIIGKPGGHGVIWKLAYDKGVFKWFYDHGRKGATVRQVSNVVAATDVTLLALAGIGLRHKKTPDGALLDILRNAYDLLTECDIELPMIEPNDKYVDLSPPYLIHLYPALGPLWEVSRQKFKGGSISSSSELQLEIAEFSWNNVQVDGSLIITADNAMGSTTINENGEPILQYGLRCGKCKLHNVKVANRGIDWNSRSNVYWRNEVNRLETCRIILHGNAEFEATNVTIQGNHVFEVPDGHRLEITRGCSDLGLNIDLEAVKEEVMKTGSTNSMVLTFILNKQRSHKTNSFQNNWELNLPK